ncbi:Chromate transporter, chromate ion transporter (CHR) family protein [Clostridium sartagoforme AAU1]|uniref:Chromate transporter, chromate ion transporter (CHR) family protein n=1 Tax=Clostridium sartagoforme AAU1 TaxID=1202534 RepID=R9BWR2_9CLOT|nr:chromate efflux transporter [Clostridium sartagoforme]EOR21165.1 Chromate transporter, chromate ion transporter (CHR) family protein [Clostridium sartagoforme AAU1]
MKKERENKNAVLWRIFLKDVFICSLGAYGGPEAHYGVFTDQMVVKKKYLNEEELVELIALTGILPGPSSTQTIVAIGYKIGGPLLALLTMLVWALPVLILMTLLSFLSQFLGNMNLSQEGLRYIGPMAVGFIIIAAYRIGSKVITDKITLILLIMGGVTTYFIREPWIYPLVLILGGVVSVITSKEKNLWNRVKISPPWIYLILFEAFAIGSFILTLIWDNKIIHLFENFYRYGYLVIGGGQVVVPLMYSELVEVNQYMTNQEFLTGFGLVQGLPGPMFSFSSYAGGMAARGGSALIQVLGAIAGGIGIFLPGLLLIYFIYPIWESLKKIRGIKISLKGITAVAGGLITVSAIILMQKSGFRIDNIIVMLITIVLLFTKKIPAPLIVLATLVAGFIV